MFPLACALSLFLYTFACLSLLLALSVCFSFPPTFVSSCVLFHILRLMLCLIWGVTSFTSMLAFTLFVLLSFSSDSRLLKYAAFFFSYLLPEMQQIKHRIPCIAFQSHQSSWEAFYYSDVALKSKHRHLRGNRWEQDLFVKIHWYFRALQISVIKLNSKLAPRLIAESRKNTFNRREMWFSQAWVVITLSNCSAIWRMF